MAGGIAHLLIRKPGTYFLKLVLSFSGAFLFALTVLHLMPGVYSSPVNNIGAWILAGFFLQILLEYFSEGIEHGHIHVHNHHAHAFPATMMISLCIHSFLEAMPLAGSFSTHSGHNHDHSLLSGIILHHVPVAFALSSMLSASGLKKSKIILCLFIFAIMGPLGAFFSEVLGQSQITNISHFYNYIMAIVIGIFLHISTTILFESGNDHRFNRYKLIAIITGGIMGLLAV